MKNRHSLISRQEDRNAKNLFFKIDTKKLKFMMTRNKSKYNNLNRKEMKNTQKLYRTTGKKYKTRKSIIHKLEGMKNLRRDL